MLRSSKHWWLWKEPVVMCENWNVRQTTSQQVFKLTTFCTDTCFQSFSPLINCSVEIQPMSQQDASATRPYCGLVLDTCALAACPRRGNLPGWGQNCWLATCQDRTDELRCLTAPRLCHEHDVLAHCLTGRQTCLQQCCRSLVAASASATRLSNTARWFLLHAQWTWAWYSQVWILYNSACIEYQSAIRTSFGSVLLRHGLNFAQRGGTQHYLLSNEKFLHFQGSAVIFFRWGG